MHVQDLKRWHWIVIGAIAGAGFALARTLSIADRPVGGADFISQAKFESQLRFSPVMGKPRIANIVIHPAAGSQIDLVSLSELQLETSQYRDRWFAAPRPYVALAQRGSADPVQGFTVSDYLLEAKVGNPSISFSNAWWESTAGAILVWGLVGMLVVGGVWPFVLNFLLGAGFGRKIEEPLMDLSQFKSEAQQKPSSEMSEEDRRRLEALESEMEASLQGDGQDKSAPAVAAPAPIRTLATAPVELAPGPAQDQKDFAGEFYPVEKKSPHGFSLVEILVVIGVIAVLVGILMPIVAHVRAQSQQVKCASNLAQIGAGLEMYNQNFKHLPLQATPAALGDALKLINIDGIMKCPADQSASLSYGLNATYAGMPKSAGNANEVMASESVKRHDGKSNVVFFDGHVDEQ
jgi:prepilin-type processing-associated H-X9-DG protein/prepilin-type N-terminal cleavage/methylation domain-containing protein